jgi:transmembrane sensor
MNEAQFKILLERYLKDILSVEELPAFIEYLRYYSNTGQLQQAIEQALTDNNFRGISDPSRTEIIFQKILQQAAASGSIAMPVKPVYEIRHTRDRSRVVRWLTAAAVMVAVFTGTYLILQKKKSASELASHSQTTQPLANDAAPGTNKAVLKLADGSEIMLDDTGMGMITQQGNTKVFKLENGELSYKAGPGSESEIVYNTLSTPRGGQYQLVLPDGSKVWLNASSSLRYPAFFGGKERIVELTGEAYFEVANNSKMPFMVYVNNLKVEVLGTHFNIMSYDNEKTVNTTLLEGSVKLSSTASDKIPEQGIKLRPGQQATLDKNISLMNVHEADVESAIAWKNGMFQFKSDDIQTIMRQVERWYDVDVNYAGKIPEGHYSGTIERNNKLSIVLEILEESGLKFKIEGKMLTIL